MKSGRPPAPFQPGDEFPPGSFAAFGSGDLARDMWLRPNRDLDDPHDILLYAISVDGYSYAREVLGRDLFDMTEELEAHCCGPALRDAAFIELRLRLFFVQRAWRHVYQGPGASGPEGDEVVYLRALHVAVCDAWDREWPVR